MPAFARCCLCIAANLLVFTNPMASPIADYVNELYQKDFPHVPNHASTTEYGVLLHRPNRVCPYCFGGYVDFARP